MKLKFCGAIVTVLAGLFYVTPVLAGAISDCYQGDEFTCQVEAEIARLTNLRRFNSGLGELTFHGHLSFVARTWSDIQAQRNSIGHDGFPSHRAGVYRNEFGSMEDIAIRGENVAMYSWGAGQTAEAVAAQLTTQWWQSSGHRANMLGSYDGIGVGVARRSNGSVFGTQIFYDGGL